MGENEIIELFWSRDETAIAETQRGLGGYLTKIAQNVLGSPEDAAECVNDTLLTAWRSIPPQRPQSLAAFLASVVRRRAIDRLKSETRQKRHPSEGLASLTELEECVPDGARAELCDRLALSEAINEYLRRLSPLSRRVFVGRYYYMDSLDEIARYCGIGAGRVKSLLFRTRRGLRDYLKKEELM